MNELAVISINQDSHLRLSVAGEGAAVIPAKVVAGIKEHCASFSWPLHVTR